MTRLPPRLLSPTLASAMNPAVLSPSPVLPAAPAAHPSAASAWEEICRGMGIAPLPPGDSATLQPWTEEETAAFERAIEETCERVEVL